MIFNPQTIITASTVPAELERAAAAYDGAAERLRRVLARLPEYLGELTRAEEVNWDSMTSDAYRSVLELLRLPGEVMIVDVSALAAEAETIAADLRYYAQQARGLLSLLTGDSGVQMGIEAASGAATAHMESLWNDARAALEGTAGRFTEFVDRHGGVPLGDDGIRQMVLPG